MSFGFSVGDILTVSKLARDTWKQFQDSPGQFQAIRTEVAGLALLLDDIAQRTGASLTDKQTQDLSFLIHASRKLLEELNALVNKYSILGVDAEVASLRDKFRKGSKKLAWDQDEVRELRSRITSNITLLNAFNSNLESSKSQANAAVLERGIEQLQLSQDHQKDQRLLDWLSPLNFPAQQSEFFNRRQEGSGQWLLGHDHFQKWVATSKDTLFCPGPPGAGKTILASIVVDHLWHTVRDHDIGVVYAYCDYRKYEEQTSDNLVASLLNQLLRQQPKPISDNINKLYVEHNQQGTRPSQAEFFALLQAEATNFSRVFIVVDALDECSNDDRTRRRLLERLRTLQNLTSVNLMVTSRPLPDITEEFESAITLEIRASDIDIRKHLKEQMSRLPRCVLKDSSLQARIVDGITGAVDGMFLLAQLYMDSLVDKTTTKAINRALDRLPIGSDALDCAYEDALRRIDMQKQGFSDLAKRTLSWITNAQRLLTIAEIRHALAIELGEDDLDEENLNEIEDIISACAGLVILESENLRLIHFTTLEYLRRHGPDHFPGAQQMIALSCLTYLQFRTFREEEYLGGSQSDAEAATNVEGSRSYDTIHARASRQEKGRPDAERDKLIDDAEGPERGKEATWKGARTRGEEEIRNLQRRIQRYPFVEYAAYFWASHVEQYTDPDIRPMIMDFVGNDYNVSIAFGLVVKEDTIFYSRFISKQMAYPRQWTGMHLAAYLGLKGLLAMLLEAGAEADAKDANNRTPLSWAAERGHTGVVRELLIREDVHVNRVSSSQQTPLHLAAASGHELVVEQLLLREDIDVNGWNGMDQNPLIMAARYGHELIVKQLLLREDIDVNGWNGMGQNPLMMAACYGHELIVKQLLLHKDVDVNEGDVFNNTPLSGAAHYGYEPTVEILLARQDVDVNLANNQLETPLAIAAGKGHDAIVKLLLTRKDVDLHARHSSRRLPLTMSVLEQVDRVSERQVLHRNLNINSREISGETPLHVASQYGKNAVVETLLAETDIEADARDNLGRTPLESAASMGKLRTVQLLLAREDVNVYSTNDSGETPLASAEKIFAFDPSREGLSEVIKLLRATVEARSSSKAPV